MSNANGNSCPHCGGDVQNLDIEFIFATGELKSGGRSCYLRPMLLQIVECLIDAYPRAVSQVAIFEALYGAREDDTMPNFSIIGTNVTQLRRALEAAGMPVTVLTVTNGRTETGFAIAAGSNRDGFINKVA